MLLSRIIPLTEENIRSSNLTPLLSPDDLKSIGQWCWEGYDKDENSRTEWTRRNSVGMDLAMQVVKDKAFPWPNAANVAFPLVTIATLQFHSRAYPALVNGGDLVKCKVVGADPEGTEQARALRVAGHMSYQLLEEDQPWEEQHDRLLINVPIVGCAFKKSYFDGARQHNVSELVLAVDLVMDYYAKSVESTQRKTHVIKRTRNGIYERVKMEVYRDVLNEQWYTGLPQSAPDTPARDGTVPGTPDGATPFILLEQHCYLDLDGDGYAEPVIITLDRDSRSVLRIVYRFDSEAAVTRNARGEVISIQPIEHFTKYGFIPAPDGSIYDMGFGVLLGPLNATVSSGINQLLDAGTMANSAGGFLGRGAKIRGGVYTFAPLEWKRVDSTGDDLRKNVFPLPVREPSNVLFQLIGLIIQYTDRISGSTEMMVGENIGQNTPAETGRNMVEQGSKVYGAIFKRMWRSMKEEFKKLYLLNTIHLPVKGTYLATREDYLGNPDRICPAADPNIVSDSQRYMHAITIAQRAATVPGYDPKAVEMNLLRALKVDAPETFYVGYDPANLPKDVKLQIAELKAQGEAAKLDQAKQEFVITLMEEQKVNAAQIILLEAQAKKAESDAASEAGWQQIESLNAMINIARQRDESLTARIKLALDTLVAHKELALKDKELKQKSNEPSN